MPDLVVQYLGNSKGSLKDLQKIFMVNDDKALFAFGPYRLEVAERRLWRHDNELVALPPKVFDLLVLLVEHRGKLLEKSYLLESLWPGTFVEEANLSVNVSVLRKVLGEGSGGENYIETVPKRGYRFIAQVEPVVVNPPAEPAPTILRRGRRRWVGLAAACILGALITGWLVWRGHFDNSPMAGLRSLAVLPFLPLDGNPAQNYLGLGMAEALVTRLSAMPKLTLTPTSAVLKYSQLQQDAVAAGRELKVDAVLVGRLQLAEKRIRVTVRLYRVSDGTPVWADTFDDSFTNIFSVQDSISERVAGAFAIKLTETQQQTMAKRSTENTEAYQYYLQAEYLATKRLKEATTEAIEYYQKAVDRDPEYALAYAKMAAACARRAGEGMGEALRDRARTAALKAISLDNELPEAHIALGEVLMRADYDWTGADRALTRALTLNGNLSAAHASRSILLTAFARHDEAIREMDTACRLEPSSAVLRSDLAWSLEFSRRYEEAERKSREAVALDPWSYTPRRQLAKALLMLARYPEALSECQRAMDISGGHSRRILAELGKVYAAWGKTAEARGILEQLRRGSWTEPEPHYEMAVLYAALGDRNAALTSLSTAIQMRLTRVIWMKVDPELDSLHGDPRFTDLLKQMRLAP